MLVAVAQIEPQLAEKERNLDACLARMEEAEFHQGKEMARIGEVTNAPQTYT